MQGSSLEKVTLTTPAWSVRMTDSAIGWNAPMAAQWHYENGLMLKAIEHVWRASGDARYGQYIQEVVDRLVDPDGNIKTYRVEEYNLDQINLGKVLFSLRQTTGDERYTRAIHLLREQLRWQPRTSERGFWHKLIYPYQMWLDGIYMAAPFYAEFASTFNEPAAFDDVAHQIILIESHTRDPRTGLLYHGWDESKRQRWADPRTGCSPHFWGRAMGWYAMAIVDVLDFIPLDHPQRGTLLDIFERMIAALTNVQDRATGLWYQILDQGGQEGNYLEASASCMFVYAIAHAVNTGYLAGQYLTVARAAYDGILKHLIQVDAAGSTHLHGTCGVAGLGGNPYRDGSFEYYVGEKVVTNDYKGVGAFILAAAEMESSQPGLKQTHLI